MDENIQTTLSGTLTAENLGKAGSLQVKRDENGRYMKGYSGNPKGKEVGTRHLTTKVREALEKIADGSDISYEEALIKKILHKAIVEGDVRMIQLIWNYLDGLPRQSIDLEGNVRIKTFMDYVYEYNQRKSGEGGDDIGVSEKSD